MAECPVCGAGVPLSGEVLVGELKECQECGAELEVKSLDPLRFEEAPCAEEDWGE